MQPVDFPGTNVVLGRGLWRTMPAHINGLGTVTTCWKLTLRERLTILFTGKLWWQQMALGTVPRLQHGRARRPALRVRGVA